MKVIRKTWYQKIWYLFCFLAMTLIMIGTFPGTVSAKDAEDRNAVNAIQTNSAFTGSPLHTLKKASDDSEVKLAEHETDILQSDSHVLSLKNTTEDMDISFKSSDTSILSVKKKGDSSCVYTGEAYGTAEIIVTVRTSPIIFFWSNESTYRTKISVTPHATSIKCVKQKIVLTEGKKATLDLTIRPGNSGEVPVFSSKDPKVATINAKGKIFAKSAGSTYVTATIDNGKTTQCRVIVKKK
ncbi:MAG: Ig-like domain-containing protein [Lachnospiraceae bacterium]|nr:Ig-like domain-containing protein [Lachnospiraceae bacterium]